jgi:hypothetical protein
VRIGRSQAIERLLLTAGGNKANDGAQLEGRAVPCALCAGHRAVYPPAKGWERAVCSLDRRGAV